MKCKTHGILREKFIKRSFSILLITMLTACGGGSSSEPIKPKLPEPTKCGSSELDTDQTCLTLDGRSAIVYAAKNQTTHDGIALFLHGAPGSTAKVMKTFGADNVAEKFNLVSVAPQGNGTNYEWNSYTSDSSDSPDIDHILALITEIQSQFTLSNNKVFIFGYSAGGFMAYKLACKAPENITGVISLAGQFRGNFDNCSTSTPIAIHHIHSTSDIEVPFNGRANGDIASVPETIEFWQNKNGCSNTYQEITQEGVTNASNSTITQKYDNCIETVGLSMLSFVDHEDDYLPEKLLATYEYLLKE